MIKGEEANLYTFRYWLFSKSTYTDLLPHLLICLVLFTIYIDFLLDCQLTKIQFSFFITR
jgi:hypothetical protein